MKNLQETLPVVFDLILSLGYYPPYITSILKEMLHKAKAPFSEHVVPLTAVTPIPEDEMKSLCFFPNLPLLRKRRVYEADSSKTPSVCTKRHSGHQSLTPGVFTLFCQHGNEAIYKNTKRHVIVHYCTGICYGFQAMRLRESPNVPFTLLYERYMTGNVSCVFVYNLYQPFLCSPCNNSL